MTREDIFKLWPRPWREAPKFPGVVEAADGTVVFTISASAEDDTATAVALFLIEWSQEELERR